MGTKYFYEYERTYVAPTVPAWSTKWPAYDGCNQRSLSTIARTPPAGSQSTGSKIPYEGGTVSRVRSSTIRGKRSSGPPYQHTPYHISKTTVQDHLVSRDLIASGINVYQQYGVTAKFGGSSCSAVPFSAPCTGPIHSEYRWNRSYGVIAASGCPVYTTERFDLSEVSAAIEEVRLQALEDALSSYDALTEASELHKVPSTFTGITGDLLTIFRSLNKTYGRKLMKRLYSMRPIDMLKHPQRIVRAFGKQWMTYRYGIMPLVYSYRDLVKLSKRGVDVTTRGSKTITPYRIFDDPPSNSISLIERDQGSITVRACMFQNFSSSTIARLSGLRFNPLVTLWELMPYSWVADWVFNMGQYLSTLSLSSLSGVRWACLSRRDKTTTGYWVSLPDESVSRVVSTYAPLNWVGALPTTPNTFKSCPAGIFPIRTTEVDAYRRWPVAIESAHFSFQPSLNWKRLVDYAVLNNQLLGSLLRSFR